MKTQIHRRGFTLIELLVVISIVALLASVVLAALNTARDKGRIGAGRYFAAQVDHIAGDSSVGTWDFDECSGLPKDSSGNSGVGSFTGSPTYSADTPNGTGCSLDIAAGQGLTINDKDSLDIGLGSATRAFWFKTSQVGGNGMFRKSDGSNALGFNIYLNATGNFKCDVGYIPGVVLIGSTSGYNNGLWHHGVCALDRTTNVLSLYVDGIFQGKTDASAVSAVDLNATAGIILPDGYMTAVFKVDGIHLFNKALTAEAVGKLYASEKGKDNFAQK